MRQIKTTIMALSLIFLISVTMFANVSAAPGVYWDTVSYLTWLTDKCEEPQTAEVSDCLCGDSNI